jgi:hypothetical protein
MIFKALDRHFGRQLAPLVATHAVRQQKQLGEISTAPADAILILGPHRASITSFTDDEA